MTKKDRPFIRYYDKNRKSVTVEYTTYRKLKADIENHANLAYAHNGRGDGEISVTRFKRGQWGEWFEVWGYSFGGGGKYHILREGWM